MMPENAVTGDALSVGLPEISDEIARDRVSAMFQWANGDDLVKLRSASRLDLEGMSDPPGEFERVDDDILERVQDEVRVITDGHGFPAAMTVGQRNSFDAQLRTLLFQQVQVPELLAARLGMWRFLSTVVLPEVAFWRYLRTPPSSVNPDRYLGHLDRDVLRSRWWRTWALGPDLTKVPDGRTALGEDEFTSIMERPTIGYSQDLAMGVRDCIWRWEPEIELRRLNRPLFMRALTRQLILGLQSIDYSGLTPPDMAEHLDELAQRSVNIAATGRITVEEDR